MKTFLKFAVFAGMITSSAIGMAKSADMPAPAAAPAGATGMCNDGSYYTGASRSGACKGHKGLKEWYAAPSAPTAAAPAAKAAMPAPVSKTGKPAPAPKPAMPATPAAPSKPAPAAKKSPTAMPAAPAMPATPAAPAATGGAGQVWMNSDSKIYHCAGSRYYGKTKQGQYMSEAAAIAAGGRPDHGKACK